MYETQRQAAAEIDYVLTRRKGRRRLLLLDMDGTVTPSRFVVELAQATGHEPELAQRLDQHEGDAVTRSAHIGKLFQFVHKKKFEQIAGGLVIRPGVIEFVKQMRRRGFMVGVISDSYFVAADIVRRRIFADFAMAHTIAFESDVCTGLININPAFYFGDESASSSVCKSNVLRHFLADSTSPSINLTWAIGDNANDLAMLRLADHGFAIEPKSCLLIDEPGITKIDSFDDLLAILPNHEIVPAGG